MHAALEASARARPSRKPKAPSGTKGRRWPPLGERWLWVVGLLAGLSHREKDELLKLLAMLKQHAVEVES